MQVANAREAGAEKSIPARILGEELKRVAAEDAFAEIVRALDEEGLLTLFSPALTGPKVNLAGLAKLEKLARLIPDDPRSRASRFGPFLYALAEKLTTKEQHALGKAAELSKSSLDDWQKLEARARKIETALRSPRVRKASQVYQIASPVEPELVLFLLYHSSLKPVQERLRNYLQKYLPAVQEITPEEWASVEGKPGTPRYRKARETFVAKRLDRRVRKPPAPEAPPPEPPVPEAALRRAK